MLSIGIKIVEMFTENPKVLEVDYIVLNFYIIILFELVKNRNGNINY